MTKYIKEKFFKKIRPKRIWHRFLLYLRNIKLYFFKKTKDISSKEFKEIVKKNINTNRICKLLDDEDLKIWLMSDKSNVYVIIDNGNKLKVLQRNKIGISYKIYENIGEYGKINIKGIKYDITYDITLFSSFKSLNNRIERLIN